MSFVVDAGFLTAGIVGAIGYVAGIKIDHLMLMQATRVWPHAAMVYFLWKWSAATGAYARWLMAGLIGYLIGDFFLRLPGYFTFALGIFLIGHILIIRAFHEGLSGWRWLRGIPFAIYEAVLLIYLWPVLGSMKIPVLIYATGISAMGWSACGRLGFQGAPRLRIMTGFAGAMLFLISDSIYSIDMFHHPIDQARYWIIATYWASLLGMTLSARPLAVVRVR